jgi:hypothetical protein
MLRWRAAYLLAGAGGFAPPMAGLIDHCLTADDSKWICLELSQSLTVFSALAIPAKVRLSYVSIHENSLKGTFFFLAVHKFFSCSSAHFLLAFGKFSD